MKKLYRNKRNGMIAGVCSGLADYLNVDVTIIRLIFVLLLFFYTGGFWIYLIMWIIVPLEPTAPADSVDVVAKQASTAAPKKVTAPKKGTPEPEPTVQPQVEKPANKSTQ